MNEARFTKGQRVRIADRTPPVHHRVPAYAKGQIGVIERVDGMHPNDNTEFVNTGFELAFKLLGGTAAVRGGF